jgi:hypothetical protein
MSVIDRPNQRSKWGFPPFVHMHDTAYIYRKVPWKHASVCESIRYDTFMYESSGLLRLLCWCNHFSLRICVQPVWCMPSKLVNGLRVTQPLIVACRTAHGQGSHCHHGGDGSR